MEPDEHLYCYRLVGGPMDGSEHLMTMDVMEMAVPVSGSEEGSWEVYSGSGSGSMEQEPTSAQMSEYYHLYLWYGKIVDGSRIMEYHGYFSDDELEDAGD